ncbi:phage conserved hypothetical protein BR0599 [Parasphingorhabdus marina DSM 22363]|uniref:Bacteriophage phiJL001 Gp84 C-terminal domain-containing protein n=1 Tax=Parasphingorhabdus marina DSM 22363 TaxID=1123272 RepID=A0A1N6CM52_9SPHN|nr:DUF2163 domain-containing protein [Parasphingorhabdus marina]SIN59621.1 phage conserved hypothetical protein BR0599 [Parasphingorhabdus marina DSM 22363]
MSLDWMDGDLTTRTYAWRLERCDGVALGFVSHDRDIWIDDQCYRASPGMVPSTISLSDSMDWDSVEIEGVMTSPAITETDLASGRWNGARLSVLLADWSSPQNQTAMLFAGEFGEISRSGQEFVAEVIGATAKLDQSIVPATSPTCRAHFGDAHCKLSLHAHQKELVVTAASGSTVECAGLSGTAPVYGLGRMRWLSGTNCGLEAVIMAGEGNDLTLADEPHDPPKAGDRVLLTAGCDKQLATCRDRFANMSNFRGEPHLPGNDLLTRYPGA